MMLRKRLGAAAIEARRLLPFSWKMLRDYRLPNGDPGQPYYLRYDAGNGITGESWHEFDQDGILRHAGIYNPVSISHYAMHCYERMMDGDAGAKDPFLQQARYLLTSQREDGLYPYTFDFPQYALSGEWYSCLAQGEAVSVLLRAYVMTGERAMLDGALRAAGTLLRDVNDGGVSLIRGDTVFFEELAQRPCHILNGHLFAAFGLWELCRFGFGTPEMHEIQAASIETLIQWLPRYDDDGWSYYQLACRDDGERHYATIFYHQIHIAQLEIYAAMTGRAEFGEMARHWRAGLQRFDVRVRVWKDIFNWAYRLVYRRVRRLRADPWHSMVLE